MLQTFEIPDAKGSNGEIMRETGNTPDLAPDESQKQERSDRRSKDKGQQSPFFVMDLCHLKNSELELQCQKYRGKVVLRCNIVRNDFGSYTVFTEQRTSASEMTATKSMEIL